MNLRTQRILKKKILGPVRALLTFPLVAPMRLLARPLGYEILPKKATLDLYLHEYPSYEAYREVQVFHNKRKLDKIWADKATLDRVADIVLDRFGRDHPKHGLCHGTRNGFEQNYLNSLGLGIKAIGTDISETATAYENSVQWDFHDPNPDWKGKFEFVYTNSLDQSWKPKAALAVWLGQLTDDGLLIIEHTNAHGPAGASDMDPFGVRPVVVPYVLTLWFGAQISICHSVAKKDNMNRDAWLFVIRKNTSNVQPL